jgi:beta-xylosidase
MVSGRSDPPFDRQGQLDIRGNPRCCGIWAPCLSHAEGLFWLVYTDVKRPGGNFKDAHNYIVTAPVITGPRLDASVISDEGGSGEHASFTGAFVRMAAFDTSGAAIAADFEQYACIPEGS